MSSPTFRVTRRAFLRTTGVGTGALVFGAYFAPPVEAQGLLDKLINGSPVPGVPLVKLKLNGDIVIITHRSEMGQGTRSTLAAAIADDLEADWNRVTLRQADSDGYEYAVTFPFPVPPNVDLKFPYEKIPQTQSPQYLINNEGAQFTDSSRSIAAYFPAVRLMGTGIRLVMIRSAAKKWGVNPEQCRAEKHRVYGPNGQSIDYRWLLLRAQKEPTPLYKDLVAHLKKPEDFRYIGKGKEPMPFYDVVDMVEGKAVYGADIDVPGMLTAMVERCPVANGALLSFDASPALAIPGVRAVLPIYPPGVPAGGVGRGFMPHAGVAVIGTNTWAALQGRRAIRSTIRWDYGPHRSYDSDEYRKHLEDRTSQPGSVARKKGNIDEALAGANTIDAHYYVPHLAQTPMEPPVAVALFKNGHMEVWASTQSPDVTQMMAGKIALDDDQCNIFSDKDEDKPCKDRLRKAATVHVPLLGGGFGRKSKPDFAVEAAILAKKMPGVPIRIQWTREDDVKFSYYNAVSSQYLKAALGANGLPTALLQRSALTSFFGTLFPNSDTWGLKDDVNMWQQRRREFLGSGEYPYASGIERAQGLEDMPFDVPNIRTENCPAENHIRVGWMRSVANIYHAFGICSFADEMAIKAGSDNHKNYLLDLIGPGRNLYRKDPNSQDGLITEVVEQFGIKAQYRNNELPLENIDVPDPDNGGKMATVVPGFPPDTSRLRAVIKQVAEDSDWDNKIKQYQGMKGRGLGIAAHRSFLSYVAIVVDVSLNKRKDDDEYELTINDMWGCIHCGLAVNRDRVIAQMQGGMLYGLSYALLGEITVKKGEVQQNNFDDYQVLRIHQTPRVHVNIVDSLDAPTGVGEPPTPAVAPALANAIVAAGGPRIHEIPFRYREGRDQPGTKIVVL